VASVVQYCYQQGLCLVPQVAGTRRLQDTKSKTKMLFILYIYIFFQLRKREGLFVVDVIIIFSWQGCGD
jgi:hypothetical protein